jgi:23S rRNA (guanosine2251-2'-O)-methyltransferase
MVSKIGKIKYILINFGEKLKMRKRLNEELGRKTIDEFRNSIKSPFSIVLDNIRSHNNIGSVFRTADAFLVEKIFLCGITAVPPHREIRKTALGATDSVEWKYYNDAMDAVLKLRQEGYMIICIEQVEDSIELQDFTISPGQKYALVFGHEINGVSQKIIDICDSCIEIPQYGTKHSFNIAVSTGIVLWELSRKLKKPPEGAAFQ